MIQLMSFDDVMPAALAGLAASALKLYLIPFKTLISEARVGDDWTSMDSILVEGEMKEISEAEMVEAIKLHTDTSKSNFCTRKIGSTFWKKSSYLRWRKRQNYLR
jgi:polyribonucleotide nucleotidyltransferase